MREFVVRGGGHDRSAGSGTESEGNEMTTMEVISQLNSLIDDRKSFIDDNGQGGDIYINDISALTAAIEAISTSGGDKLYTAFDIIRMVQETVSEEICGLGDETMVAAYEVERGIIRKLVKEEDA